MPHNKHPRITSFRIDNNADADRLAEHYARTLTRVAIEPLVGQKHITVEKLHYKVGPCGIWGGACHSGMQIKLLDPSNAYVIYLPIAGELDIDVGSKRFSCEPEHVFVGDFSTMMDCRSPAIGKISTAATLLWTILTNEPETFALGKFAELMFQSLAVLLLESVPHNYSAALARPVAPAIPKHVKRAIDFMIVNVSMPMTIADVARESGCSLRSLHLGFQQYKGISPLQFLRQIRLEGVRRDLIGDGDHSTISQIAQRWGFTHMGLFAALYRDAFGQSPSEAMQSRRTR